MLGEDGEVRLITGGEADFTDKCESLETFY